ncbi:protein tiptop [Teleopsis dalmanni]|uniref:protein tiptop n=1 Tax=Teleopsis dalmanni TaxID=139649 RepID=UPI0018CD2CC6|nr:protein tiptop [Teleopsis dalmanni]
MMLHEAVMLEIYRQALNASELASPRCQSRDSNQSGAAVDARCPSTESHCSQNESFTHDSALTPTVSPVGLPLPATLAPAAAAALLPPQSAAMAAYLNAAAAAAAAQQNHLLLTNPLAAAASLVQQAATQSHSPSHNTRHTSDLSTSPIADADAGILDFSTKRGRRESENASDEEDIDESNNAIDTEGVLADGNADDANSPLDLSVGTGRKRENTDDSEAIPPSHKISRSSEYKSVPAGTWVPPINPYLAAVAAASLSPKTSVSLDWNGKQKLLPNEATKALEKMTEMTRLGTATETEVQAIRQTNTAANNSNLSGTTNGRHSAWQSHWLNKGADAVKDVFKCVWCKQSFPTLASLTTHMKETQHCGVNVSPSVSSGTAPMTTSNSSGNQTAQSTLHARHSATQSAGSNSSSAVSSTANNVTNSTSSKSDLNLLIKETMPLPRKLVRGQDVWLGKGAEQTRQILKCMWCGQSFRSLAEMTSHMQETQHYTNIISQEQIISWKSSDDKSAGNSSSNSTTNTFGAAAVNASTVANMSTAVNTATSNATVSAVLTCKVCDQAFSSLKELSNHMVKNAHYKEHMIRTASDNNTNIQRRGRQTREKRKKSLPVRKLLELERAQQDFKNSNCLDPALKPLRDFAASTKITCEKCGDKIETALFVDHIRQCLGGNIPMSPRHNNNNNSVKLSYVTPLASPQTPHSRSDSRKTAEENISPLAARPDILCPLPKDGEKASSTPSVLNAIEQLIEKSFDTRSRHGGTMSAAGHANTPLGASILKRLGIDDTVDYTKPLMDAQTMHFLRSYSSYSGGRDRSASESSSVSERGSSRLESVTPERNSEISRQTTPRLTPDKMATPNEANLHAYPPREQHSNIENIKVKSEPSDITDLPTDTAVVTAEHNTNISQLHEMPKKISVKKEFSMTDDDEMVQMSRKLATEHEIKFKPHTPSSRAISPSISERSLTPKSTVSTGGGSSGKKLLQTVAGSSLNALSSMFDNLSNMTATNACHSSNTNTTTGETNNNNSLGKKPNANPLAALQKLCETTDPPAANTRSSAGTMSNVTTMPNNIPPSATNGGSTTTGGSMVAFSWACNDAVMTADSIIKCSFCDTPFCSKGAYRHHLSKVHFVKDDCDSQSSHAMKSPGLATSPKSIASPKSSSKSPAAHRTQALSPSNISSTPTINPYDESPQSKFLKYTELAKQLSSKNV